MNDFESKRQARIERMKARAERMARAGAARLEAARARADRIPMGQPILVGHHSERRHRSDLAKIDRGMRAGFELSKEAEDLARRAAKAETSTSVSSDDPEAVVKLLGQIEEERAAQERVKEANKALKAGKPDAEVLAILQWAPDKQRTLDIYRSMGKKTLPTTNGSANIRRLEERVKVLREKAAKGPAAAESVGDVEISEADNRTKLRFPSKPSPEIIRELKGAGFRWTPSEGVWQRMASNQAQYQAKRIAEKASLASLPPVIALGAPVPRHDVLALEASHVISGGRLPDE